MHRTAPFAAGRSPLLALPLFAALLAGAAVVASAQGEEAPPLGEVTLERIMADPDWIGRSPEAPYWADDGSAVYYRQKRAGEEHRDLLRLDLSTGEALVVPFEEMGGADVGSGHVSADRRLKAYEREGDIFVKELPAGPIRQLTRTAEAETAPRVMTDGRGVAFQRDDAWFVRDLVTGLERQPAELRLEKDPEDVRREKKEKETYLQAQQERLLEVVRKRREDREREEELGREARRADPARTPLPWYLGEDLEIRRSALSPAGDRLLVVLGKGEEDEGQAALLPDYVTESGYIETREARSKVGTGKPVTERLLLLDLETHERHELDLAALPGILDDPLADLREAAEARRKARAKAAREEAATEGQDKEATKDEKEGGEAEAAEGDVREKDDKPEPRPVLFDTPLWTDDGARALVVAYSRDNKDRWIAAIDFEAGRLAPVHRLHDAAWINWEFNEAGWLPDGRTLFYLSEEDGFSHLYLHDAESGKRRRLTRGDFVVGSVQVSPDGAHLYFRANREHPGTYDVYRVAASGGEPERITALGGLNEYVLSPDGTRLLVTHSTITRPPELYVQAAAPGAEATRVTRTLSDAFAAVEWIEPGIVPVPSSHGARPVWARLYRPEGAVAQGGPAVFFIHGAGYLQNAHHGWSYYFREFMFHTLLVRRGYTVLDMDYRGSAGYGRDWRTAIYRHMGGPELEDLADGVRYLVAERGVDRARIGVYGGSYGGFLTLMALFKEPDLFACGAALRLVSDWAHYNHPYTANILNTPDLDPEAYERSSPIEFASGLARPLLMAAPMVDDNVFFQDTVRLVQRLIELEKQDFEVALYPVEPHAFRQPSSWLDEYRRIFKLFERELKANKG